MTTHKKHKPQPLKVKTENVIEHDKLFLSLLMLYVIILFSYTFKHQFINYDDPYYIVHNPLIKNLSWDGLKEIFTTPVLGMYNPLTFIVYAIEYEAWGLNPKGFHFVNLLCHLIASTASFYFAKKLSGRFGTAMIVAILFAIHPMHVSVVAWSSQTKTSLFVIFYFIGLIQYMDYLQSKRLKNYILTLVCLLLALLSKPSAVTFAPMLLLIDYYQSRKWNWKMLLEKIPFFGLAFAMGLVNLLTHSGTDDSIFNINQDYSIWEYLLIGNYSLTFYFEKFIAPFQLSMVYPYPKPGSLFPINYYIGLGILPIIAFGIYKAGTFRKDLLFGLGFFIIAISIVLRILPAGDFGMGNRYSYLSYTGLFFVVAQFFMNIYEKKQQVTASTRNKIMIAGSIILLVFSGLTIEYVKVWENSITVYNDVLKKHPHYEIGYNQRALALVEKGDYTKAIQDLNKVIEINPNYLDAYLNRGEFKADLQDYDGAIKDFEKCLSIDSNESASLNNIGQVYLTKRQANIAIPYLDRAIKVNPKQKETLYNRGLAYADLGRIKEAFTDLNASKELGFAPAGDMINQLNAGLKSGKIKMDTTSHLK
jgi:tetratricopeptide (TPR) repeat protein